MIYGLFESPGPMPDCSAASVFASRAFEACGLTTMSEPGTA